ncbi:hypothetical protein ABZX30_08405 [Streptomyces sp. NPDC004542]|uniref:hypothetical protein n=1 Tax=Streptomyces sp. NPDC004542 TaxID=3154281 RepID=UPI0033BB8C2C
MCVTGEIKQQLGSSQMHVSRLISRCCDRVREQVMRDGAQDGGTARACGETRRTV